MPERATVRLAKTAGFCFGVERAVGMVDEMLNGGERIAILGEIIHNPHVTADFAGRGALTVESAAEVPPGYKAVIRAHGAAVETYEALRARGLEYRDATCPYVAKIHSIAEAAAGEGSAVLIAGDEKHPEVLGIASRCVCGCHIFSSAKELLGVLSERISSENSYILLAQTTFNLYEWQKCVELVKNRCTNIKIFDTICNATILRQREAESLSRKSDLMLVVGGKGSSNTTRLLEICQSHAASYLVESAAGLSNLGLCGAKNIGVTAGASTPAFIIKEVTTTMSEILNTQDEQSFEELLEQSFKTINSREKVTAVVTNVSPNEIAVDIGTKHAGYVPLHEFTDDPNANLSELVKVGDELELMVLRVNDVEGTAMLSKKRLDAIAGFEKLVEAEKSGETLEGVVVDAVKGGVIALTSGVRVFIPASQATVARGQELESLIKQPVSFKILETNRQRRRAVGSVRKAMKEQREELEGKFWAGVENGKVYEGTVKSLTSYGAFVDLGGVDGMVHISELSWSRVKHPSEVVNVDDKVEVYVKEVDKENKKISLGYKKTEDNPWEVLQKNFKPGDVCKARVVSMTPFGAFAQLIPGVDGLIHISQISNERVNKPQDVLAVGQEVDVKITEIDFEKKRVSLSIRALLDPPDRAREPQPVDEAPALVYEAGPGHKPEPEAAPEAPAEPEEVAEAPEEAE